MRRTSKIATFAGTLGLVLGLTPGLAFANHDRETDTTLASSATVINEGATIALSGAVTWFNSNSQTDEPVDDGSVTVSRGDSDCSASSLAVVGTKALSNGDNEFSFDDTPPAGVHGYIAEYSGATHGGQTKYVASESACVVVTVNSVSNDTGRGGPAIANEYINGFTTAEVEECVQNAGTNKNRSNWRGNVISTIAKEFNPVHDQPWDEDDVRSRVDQLCGLPL